MMDTTGGKSQAYADEHGFMLRHRRFVRSSGGRPPALSPSASACGGTELQPAARAAFALNPRSSATSLCCALLFGLTVFFSINVKPAFAESRTALAPLGEIPVQHGGRIKPFESFAREAVLYVTGRSVFRKLEPSQLVWEWIGRPEQWNGEPLIPVSYPPLAAEFSVKVIQGRLSPEIILEDSAFLKKVQSALALRQQKEKLPLLDQKRLEIYEKALFFRAIGEGDVPGWIPHPEDPSAAWLALESLTSAEGQAMLLGLYPADKAARVMEALKAVLLGFREKGPSGAAGAELTAALQAMLEARGVILPRPLLALEVRYLHLAPFARAWPFYLAAAFWGLLGSAVRRELVIPAKAGIYDPPVKPEDDRKKQWVCKMISNMAWIFFIAAFTLHTYGFYLRCMIAGRPPVSNMYESIIWVSWAAAFFSWVLSLALRAPAIRHAAGLVAALALILAQKFPVLLDPSIAPLVPVLRSNLWLTVHVLTITLGYGAFALSWGLGHAAVFAFAFKPAAEEANRRLCQYTYRAVQIGVILLAAGTVLGGVWANYSWGRFWGWDPKETWALIALLGYILVLHGRFSGWLKPFGFAAGSVFAFLGVLMAWYGVNFVLAAGLHSYGFGGGGLPYVAAAAALDAALIGALALRVRFS